MVKAKKTAANGMPRRGSQKTYIDREYKTDSILEDGSSVPPYIFRMQSDLRERDTEKFVFKSDTLTTDVWEIMAPYVVAWNVDDDDGEPVPPPAEAGGRQFNWVPNQIFWQFFNDIKFRSSGTVDSKSWKPSATTADGSSDGSTTTTS